MIIYGVALLSICYLTGVVVGDLLGQLIGVNANVGGIGIAMLLLIVLTNLRKPGLQLPAMTASGIHFWSAMYIPIVIAMAAKQNVIGAITSGWLAIIAGVLAVIASFLLIPVLSKLGNPGNNTAPAEADS